MKNFFAVAFLTVTLVLCSFSTAAAGVIPTGGRACPVDAETTCVEMLECDPTVTVCDENSSNTSAAQTNSSNENDLLSEILRTAKNALDFIF